MIPTGSLPITPHGPLSAVQSWYREAVLGDPRLLDLLHSVFDVFMASALRSVDGDWALDE
jgi:hypothetical protein